MTYSLKTLTAAAIVAVAGSAAFAGPNYIMPGEAQNLNSSVTLDLVRADANATVDVYDFHGGERGALLGSAPVKAGANTDVYVPLSRPASKDAVAVLMQAGSEVATVDLNEAR
nr:hypothetical protein [uncultured Celeribacter sp.]